MAWMINELPQNFGEKVVMKTHWISVVEFLDALLHPPLLLSFNYSLKWPPWMKISSRVSWRLMVIKLPLKTLRMGTYTYSCLLASVQLKLRPHNPFLVIKTSNPESVRACVHPHKSPHMLLPTLYRLVWRPHTRLNGSLDELCGLQRGHTNPCLGCAEPVQGLLMPWNWWGFFDSHLELVQSLFHYSFSLKQLIKDFSSQIWPPNVLSWNKWIKWIKAHWNQLKMHGSAKNLQVKHGVFRHLLTSRTQWTTTRMQEQMWIYHTNKNTKDKQPQQHKPHLTNIVIIKNTKNWRTMNLKLGLHPKNRLFNVIRST